MSSSQTLSFASLVECLGLRLMTSESIRQLEKQTLLFGKFFEGEVNKHRIDKNCVNWKDANMTVPSNTFLYCPFDLEVFLGLCTLDKLNKRRASLARILCL